MRKSKIKLSFTKLKKLPFFGILLSNLATCTILPNGSKHINHDQLEILPSDEVCITPGCVKAALLIIANMNESVGACDDFYEFACGNYVTNTEIPDGKNQFTLVDSIYEKFFEQLKGIIESERQENDPKAFELLKSYYKSCMDHDKFEEDNKKDFLEITRKSGGWPIVEGSSWNESSFDWVESIHSLHKFGYRVQNLITLDVKLDMNNSSKYIIELDQNSFVKSLRYLSSSGKSKPYQRSILHIAKVFGANGDEVENDVENMIDFEIDLANISQPLHNYEDSNKINNPMSIEQLQSECPVVDWVKFINGILQPYAQVDSNEIINVASPRYFQSLSNLIGSTEKRVLANYIMWNVAYDSMPFLSERLRAKQRRFIHRGYEPTHWKYCTDSAMSMNLAYDALYVRRYLDASVKTNVLEMTRNIKQSIHKIIQNEADWMENKTKQVALEKLDSMKEYIAYPDEYLDNDKLDEYYANLVIFPNSYYKSNLNLNSMILKHEYKKLKKPIDKSNWIDLKKNLWFITNHNSAGNSINVAALMVQDVFFSNDRPHYVNYGALGQIISHEIIHGFDDIGMKFDKHGKFSDWWDPKSRKEFVQRTQCLVNQYNEYKSKKFNITINGELSKNENIADNSGIRAAYLAYKDWERYNGKEASLPNLRFTPQQMFWINTANIYCSKFTKVGFEKISQHSHCPGEFRVIGSFSNMPEFAQDFECPLGSNMNPVKKCKVW